MYFTNVITKEELKSVYRQLVMIYHPDRGGDVEIMKKINYEYARRMKKLEIKPRKLDEVTVGHIIMVNKSQCVVTEVYRDYFKARSLKTNNEAYFSKATGYAMLNFKLKASIIS